MRLLHPVVTRTTGFTLIEVLAASIVLALLAAGTLLAFLAATKISAQSHQNAEAAYLAQQTLERYRNQIACDSHDFDGVPEPAEEWVDDDCNSVANFTKIDGGQPPPGYTQRDYQVQAQDCTGDNVNDCFLVTATISWQSPQ